MFKKLPPLVILAFLVSNVYGTQGQFYGEFGGAIAHPKDETKYGDVKFIELGYQKEVGKFIRSAGIGGWSDTTNYEGSSGIHLKDIKDGRGHTVFKGGDLKEKARSSYYFTAMVGVEPKTDSVYLSYKIGPAIITHTDALLGSNLQVHQEIELGLYDSRGVRFGLCAKHMSNAGIVKPNLGRNFMGIKAAF